MQTDETSNIYRSTIRTETDFKAIYDAHWEQVYAICVNNTGEKELSKDMTQDIFSSIWQRRKELVIDRSIENYLARSAKMKVSEYFRNKETQRHHLKVIKQARQTSVENTDEKVVISLFNKHLYTLLKGFSSTTKKVFQLSYQKGLDTKQIALALKTTERNVQYHKKKGRQKLKTAQSRGMIGFVSFFVQLFGTIH